MGSDVEQDPEKKATSSHFSASEESMDFLDKSTGQPRGERVQGVPATQGFSSGGHLSGPAYLVSITVRGSWVGGSHPSGADFQL